MSCSIDVDYDDYPSFYHQKIQKAKKEYKCNECYDPIHVGEKYELTVGKWNGEFDTFKTCMTCKEIRENVFCSYTHGTMWEDLGEFCDYGRSLDYNMIDGLSVKAIEKIENRYETNWSEED